MPGAEGAFVRAFKAEMETAAHDALVELYTWVNNPSLGVSPELRQRGEDWAAEIEAAGLTWEVLRATSDGAEQREDA